MFKNQNYIEKFVGQSVRLKTHYNKDKQRHGEERSWWDKYHRYPRTLTIYNNNDIIRTTKWYQNGQLQYTMNIDNDIKIEIAFFNNGTQKYIKKYKLVNNEWLRSGIWIGYYDNLNIKYKENYDDNYLEGDCFYYDYKGNLKRIINYCSGNIITSNDFNISLLEKFDNMDMME